MNQNSNTLYFKSFRVESLSDGVFSIAMTLLILEMKMPAYWQITSESDLIDYFFRLDHKVYSYLLSFVTLGIYWIGHHRQFLFIKHSDRFSLWINVFFLMAVSIVPFTTEILGEFNQFRSAIILYGANIILIGLLLWYNWKYSIKHNLIPMELMDAETYKLIQERTLTAPALYLLAILLSFYNTNVSLVIFFLIQLLYIFPSKFDRNLRNSIRKIWCKTFFK